MTSRVIIHLDLDCFYVQVEQQRLSIPRDTPCAVQQWQGLIAVNYAARAAGITRHMRVHEAVRLCPALQLVHVQTIGAGDEGAVPSTATAPAAAAAAAGPGAAEVEGSAADRQTAKACLQRYRRASAAIMSLLASLAPGCPFEKASIDEAYLDISALCARELAAAEAAEGGLEELLAAAGRDSIVAGGGSGQLWSADGRLSADAAYDRLAAAGSAVAARLRGQLLQQLGYTASCGIAANKLLAKIASASNKPNKQTLLLPRAAEALMADLPLAKIKGLGGKLGAKLEAMGAATAGQAAGLSWDALLAAFEGKAKWVWDTVRGVDEAPVLPRELVKSINSCKSFAATSNRADTTRWLAILSAELAERLAEDEDEHHRRPRTLVLQYRLASSAQADRSIRGPLPSASSSHSAKALAQAAATLFGRVVPEPFPCVRLALVATDFVELPHATGSSAAMARFLAAGAQQQQQQQLAGAVGAPQPAAEAAKRTKQHKPQQHQQQLEQFFAQQPEPQDQQHATMAPPPAGGSEQQQQQHASDQQQQQVEAQQQAQPPPPGASSSPDIEPGGAPALSEAEIAALGGSDLAEQARIERDILAAARRQQQQPAASRGSGQAGGKKRKGGSQAPSAPDSKQRRISAMFSKQE